MKTQEIIELILKEFPAWNDQIELDEYDAIGIIKILVKAGLLKVKEG